MIRTKEFIIYTGPMFATKTSQLIAKLDRCLYQQKKWIIFKPKIDTRYSSDNTIVTHTGVSVDCIPVEIGTDIVKYLLNNDIPDVIAVDEAFMIPGISNVLINLYRATNVCIYVSSLDMSSHLKPFHEVSEMLPWATSVVKCTSVCSVCGADAAYTYKKVHSDDEIVVGGVELYEARCATHHPEFAL